DRPGAQTATHARGSGGARPRRRRAARRPAARADRALTETTRSRDPPLSRRPAGGRGRGDARLLRWDRQDARLTRPCRAAEVAGGDGVNIDFDSLRDPDAPIPGDRQRAGVNQRARQLRARSRTNRLALSSVSVVAVVALVFG